MIVINNVDSQKFSFNGVEYFKNFTPVVVGNKIRVLNTYDSSIELTDAPRLYSDFEVNGVVYGNVINLQTALLPILYTRNSLVGDFLSSDISTYSPATTPLTGTEKALIHDGIDFKEVAVSEIGGGDFIPLSGTTEGNPVTGNIEFENFKGLFSKLDDIEFGRFEFDEAFPRLYYVRNEIEASYATQKLNGLLIDSENVSNFIGVFSNNDYSENDPTNKLIYAQRQYVDNQNKIATFTIELIEYLTVDFYASNDLKINTITQIVNTPTITILVNDLAYTLTDLISQGDKITITSDIVGVINLNAVYE